MTDALVGSARERSDRCRRSVLDALAAMEAAGTPINLKRTAAWAGVSRNFIYATPDLFTAVREAARRSDPGTPSVHVGATRASEESLRTRLLAALNENQELRERVAALESTNARLVHEVIDLQNPEPENVVRISRRRV
jgi:hypothetical protein